MRRSGAIAALPAVVTAVLMTATACGGSSAEPAAGSSPHPSATKAGDPEPHSSPTPAPSPTDIPPNGEDIAYVVRVDHVSGKPYLEFDRVLFLSGDAANDAAAQHGAETPVPNDYYVVNDNDIIRTFRLTPDAVVIKSTALGCPPGECNAAEKTGDIGDLESFLEEHPDDATRILFNLRYDSDGRIDRIQEIYLP